MDLLHLWCIIGVILQRTVNGQQLVSQGKPVTSSSTHKTWSPDKAVDGKKTPLPDMCDCCAVTDLDYNPWFVLDLEQTYIVQRINVIGRTEHHSLREMEIKLGTSKEGGTVLTKNTDEVFTYDYTLPSPQLGRYVTLTLRGITQYFVICELEVYAECSGNTYGNPCVPCGKCLNGDPCDKNNGSCQSCAAGYQGNKCVQACNQHMYGLECVYECGKCDNDVTCNNVDGTCAGCKTGYMAPMCKDCSIQYYGVTCDMRCYCTADPCDRSTGLCPAGGCITGYKGDKCDTQCDSKMWGKDCLRACGNCLNGGQCNVFDGGCPDGCSAGYKGQLCTKPCEDGIYGPNCNSTCGNCLNNATCNKQDGRCDSCAAGYKGDKCLDTCDPFTHGGDCKETCGSCSNNTSCNRVDGSCPSGCRPGFKGELCKEECGVKTYGNSCIPCGHCLNDTPCDKQDGTCSSCAAGYLGDKCEEVCSDGFYGIDCQLMCGKCHRQSVCLKDTGNCHQGCEPGFLGPLCHRECEDGTYGEGCTSICGNCYGDEICNKQNGTCQACECGYTGHDCKGILGDINPAASRGDYPNVAMIVGGTLVSILAIEGVAVAIFVLIRKRRHSLKKDTVNRSNPYELPNRAINEGEHEYESAMELDVTTNAYENTGPQAP